MSRVVWYFLYKVDNRTVIQFPFGFEMWSLRFSLLCLSGFILYTVKSKIQMPIYFDNFARKNLRQFEQQSGADLLFLITSAAWHPLSSSSLELAITFGQEFEPSDSRLCIETVQLNFTYTYFDNFPKKNPRQFEQQSGAEDLFLVTSAACPAVIPSLRRVEYFWSGVRSSQFQLFLGIMLIVMLCYVIKCTDY